MICVFESGGSRCLVCGAPRVAALQVCGTWSAAFATSYVRPGSVDITKARASRLPEPPPPPTHGPGTELSKLLKRIGINPTPTCQCRAMSQKMDQWGCDECERPERIAEVVAVMRAEAEARGLPFLDLAGRMLVRRAIRNARRNA